MFWFAGDEQDHSPIPCVFSMRTQAQTIGSNLPELTFGPPWLTQHLEGREELAGAPRNSLLPLATTFLMLSVLFRDIEKTMPSFVYAAL